tara:strand:+ start:202 stop:933 length:732 start_codon:yes stop_codon:yes gene_type:complete
MTASRSRKQSINDQKAVIRAKGERGISWHNVPKTGVITITGFRGTGKTALAWWLTDELRNTPGFPSRVATYNAPDAAMTILPEWARTNLTTVREIADLQKDSNKLGYIIVIDEAVLSNNARRAMSKENVDFMSLFALLRQKGHLVIFIAQDSNQMDVAIIDQADLLLMKKPSALQVKRARATLSEQLNEAFVQINEKQEPRAWVYAYDPMTDGSKLLKSQMPVWWTDKVSTMYGEMALDLGEE